MATAAAHGFGIDSKGGHESSCNREDALFQFDVLLPALLKAEIAAVKLTNGRCTVSRAVQNELVAWIVLVHKEQGLRETTLFLAVQLLRRALVIERPRVPRVMAAAALLVAAKFEEEMVPELQVLAEEAQASSDSGNGILAEEVSDAELELLHLLDFRLHLPTAAHHLHWSQAMLGGKGCDPKQLRSMAMYICELGLTCVESCSWLPSLHAGAAALLAAALLQRPQSLSSKVESFCVQGPGGEMRREQLRAILRKLCGLLGDTWHHCNPVYQKHSDEAFDRVAPLAHQLAVGKCK